MPPQQIETRWEIKTISKELSRVLRHTGERLRITFRADGYAPLDEVLQNCAYISREQVPVQVIEYVVRTNFKSRFQLHSEGSVRFIRAVQGHGDLARRTAEAREQQDIASGSTRAASPHEVPFHPGHQKWRPHGFHFTEQKCTESIFEEGNKRT